MRRFLMNGTLLGTLALMLPAFGSPNSGGSGIVAVVPKLNQTQTFSDPGIETFPNEGQVHVPVGTVVVYMTDPPTSGNHYPSPQAGGYFESPIAAGFLVHSMEHGGVIIYYNPATVTDAQKYTLKLLARNHPGIMAMVVCVPRNDPIYPIILTAWTHRLRLTTYDQSRIDGFVALFLGQGPEKGPISPAPLTPTPLVSRGKPVFASVDNADAPSLVDGVYGMSGPGASWRPATLPAWASIHIGPGYSSLLLSWNTPGNAATFTGNVGAPQAYTVDTSSNSTDGADGTWTTVVTVTNNAVRARAHQVDFTGKSWVRLTVSLAPQGVDLDEIDVHSLPPSRPDTVFFMGDSITSVSFNRVPAHQPSYAEAVHGSDVAFFPAMIDGGIVGDLSADGASHVSSWLALNPQFMIWALGYGTNDAMQNALPDTFRANLQTIIDHVKAAGGVPILARIPYSPLSTLVTIPAYNQIIDALVVSNALVPGPDLYAWFSTNPSQLGPDAIHPTNDGAVSINRLWAQALSGLYVDLPPPPPPPLSNAAQYVSEVVPTAMGAGGTYAVSVTMKNTGTTTWTAASNYNLGSQNAPNNTTWGMSRVALDAADSVGPGQMKTFTWNITVPSTPGTYDFQWRMVQTGVESFGEVTPDIAVKETQAAPPPSPSPSNGSSGNSSHCGLLGLEVLASLFLLSKLRRRTSKRSEDEK
jgi:acyl-CoA thioesterase-1